MSSQEQLGTGEQRPSAGQMPLIGERIRLSSGAILERPSAEVIAWLQQQDPRVHYFPADVAAAERVPRGTAYAQAVSGRIGQQVQRDFPGVDVSVRGTVVSLTEAFPYWQDDRGGDMRPVLDILASGSDTGDDRTRVGQLLSEADGDEEGRLNHHTLDWLESHTASALMELVGPQREQVFPALLVYPPEAFAGPAIHGWNELAGDPSQRLAAVYVTDRIL